MKKVLFVLLGVAALAVTLPVTAEDNLLQNRSFEEPKGATGENPAGWYAWNWDYNGINTEVRRTGSQAIYVSAEAKPESHSGILYHYKAVKPGKTYSFSCYVRNSSKDPITAGAYGQVSIEWVKDDKEIDDTRTWGDTWGADLSASDWKLVNVTGAAPEGADSCKFVIQFFNKDGKGIFYADDAVATEK